MTALIYQPDRNAMQSGTRGTKAWVLEFDRQLARNIDPLTGWTGSNDTASQVKMTFPSADDAKRYAERNDIPYQVIKKPTPKRKPKSYSENFATDRKEPWTH